MLKSYQITVFRDFHENDQLCFLHFQAISCPWEHYHPLVESLLVYMVQFHTSTYLILFDGETLLNPHKFTISCSSSTRRPSKPNIAWPRIGELTMEQCVPYGLGERL